MNIYKEIEERMKGEIYVGVVGPVRTGKSTFIRRFMEELIIPNMSDEYARARAKDELPLAADGKMVTTTEPKFIPKDEAHVEMDDVRLSVRLIDCVGFMVKGAFAGEDEGMPRMVKTPWHEEEIPFPKAAEIGTRKVIEEHSGIGIVVTTDGTIGALSREAYVEAEERTIQELDKHGKPYVILLNTVNPHAREAGTLAEQLSAKYGRPVLPVNCLQLKKEEIHRILQEILYEFPLDRLEIFLPKWVEMTSREHPLKQAVIRYVRQLMEGMTTIRNAKAFSFPEDEYVEQCKLDGVDLARGCVRVTLSVDDSHYYGMLASMTGMEIGSEYDLIVRLKELAQMKGEYEKVEEALTNVRQTGYGVVSPAREEIRLDEPVVIKHGGKFGVKLKAYSPSIHFIRANIETEIAPIVGSQQQAEDLMNYIRESSKSPEGIWATNIFGKSVEQLVDDGIRNKIVMMGEESQKKLQDTMEKIVNEGNGGLVCIII